jgi:hypothetical protein
VSDEKAALAEARSKMSPEQREKVEAEEAAADEHKAKKQAHFNRLGRASSAGSPPMLKGKGGRGRGRGGRGGLSRMTSKSIDSVTEETGED